MMRITWCYRKCSFVLVVYVNKIFIFTRNVNVFCIISFMYKGVNISAELKFANILVSNHYQVEASCFIILVGHRFTGRP